MKFEIHRYHHFAVDPIVGEVLRRLARIDSKLEKIMDGNAQIQAALTQIDQATTSIGANVAAQAATIKTISDEISAFQTALANEGVPQAIIDQAASLGSKAQAASDALTANVAALNAIASQGASNPVPVAVPTPTPTDPTTTDGSGGASAASTN